MRTVARFSAVAAAAALATAFAAPANAEGSHFTVLDEGHVDVLGVAFEDGELHLHVHDEETDTEYEADEVVLAANPEAETTVPSDPAYDFLGEAGDPVWILPDTETEGLLFAGWASEEVPAGAFEDDSLTLTVLDAKGCGDVALYTIDDFGSPDVLFDSEVGPGSWDIGAEGHGHLNWGFTDPGVYKLTVEAEGVLAATGETVSTGEVDYWFSVRD